MALRTKTIPEEALKTIEARFGSRFVQHTTGEVEPGAEKAFGSVFPMSAEEVESLTRLAARHSIPLVARGGPPLPEQDAVCPRGAFRCDARHKAPGAAGRGMGRGRSGVTWMGLEERLRETGMGPTVYPTSAPRSTVGGWLAENGLGVGSTSTAGCSRTSLWRLS